GGTGTAADDEGVVDDTITPVRFAGGIAAETHHRAEAVERRGMHDDISQHFRILARHAWRPARQLVVRVGADQFQFVEPGAFEPVVVDLVAFVPALEQVAAGAAVHVIEAHAEHTARIAHLVALDVQRMLAGGVAAVADLAVFQREVAGVLVGGKDALAAAIAYQQIAQHDIPRVHEHTATAAASERQPLQPHMIGATELESIGTAAQQRPVALAVAQAADDDRQCSGTAAGEDDATGIV